MKTTERSSRRGLTRLPVRRKIKILLASKDMTQTDLANIINVSPQYVSGVINGKKRVSHDNPIFQQMADVFGLPIDELFPLIDVDALAEQLAPSITDSVYSGLV